MKDPTHTPANTPTPPPIPGTTPPPIPGATPPPVSKRPPPVSQTPKSVAKPPTPVPPKTAPEPETPAPVPATSSPAPETLVSEPLPTECINPDRPVWISYVDNCNEKPEWEHIADCVDELIESFKKYKIEYRIDDSLDSSANITDFEKRIGWDSDVVVLVFSDRYFRSLHCMYQFVQIKKAMQNNLQKRLFCVKSGSFNLSDINYILDLEHYWGDKKQEYNEVSYHKTRPLMGVEHVAHENGFYTADVRSLYSFFSTLNYANAASQNWDAFAKEIIDHYKNEPSKISQIITQAKKTRNTTLKAIGCGCLSWFLVPVVIFLCLCFSFFWDTNVSNPKYSKGLEHLKITEMEMEFALQNIRLTFNLENPYNKDTLIYASRDYYVESNDKKYYLTKAENIPLFPDRDVLAAHESRKFVLEFSKPSKCDSLNFVMRPGEGIYGIKFEEE